MPGAELAPGMVSTLGSINRKGRVFLREPISRFPDVPVRRGGRPESERSLRDGVACVRDRGPLRWRRPAQAPLARTFLTYENAFMEFRAALSVPLRAGALSVMKRAAAKNESGFSRSPSAKDRQRSAPG